MVKRLTNPLRDRPVPLGSLLAATAHRLGSELDSALAAAGFEDVRSAHAPVFMAIGPDGVRAGVLAQQAHLTKQAMGELLHYLSGHGYVETTADPDDGRARIVRLTARGWRVVDAAEQVIAQFDSWLESTVGTRRVDEVRATMQVILASDRQVWDR